MAIKLDNNEEHELTSAEKVWSYKNSLKINSKKLKKMRKTSLIYSVLSYACVGMLSYESGKTLSNYINHQEDSDMLYFLLTTSLVFWNNYNGVNCIREAHKYGNDIRMIKGILKNYESIEKCSEIIPDEVVKALESAANNTKILIKTYEDR